MKYDYQISPYKKNRFLKKFYILLIIIFFMGAILVGLIRLDAYLQTKRNTPQQTTTEKTTAYYAPTTKIFRTQYFQFQTQNNWTEIPSDLTEKKFVYRGQNKSIIEEELIIYVNDIPKDISATRIVPVKIEESRLYPGQVSEHCNETVGGFKSNDKLVSYKGVRVNCDIDSTQYNVLVGLSGGTTELRLTRPDRTTATYTIFYRNVKAVLDASELIDILESFQAR